MKNIKTYMVIGVGVTLLTLLLLCVYKVYESSKYKELYLKELTNVKAYQAENSNLKGSAMAHMMTISQLQISKDSADIALKEALDKLKIKPKNVVSAGSVTSNIEKRDSIFLTDTVFVNNVNVDTIIGDKWYQAKLGLHYPSKIDLAVSMQSVKHIVVHTRRETINPPKKFFLFRWFQKKHTVTIVDVAEDNPYIKAGSQRFIKIVK